MFRLASGLKVYLHRDAVDGRKNINGLALLVEQDLGLDPCAAAVYVFSNRRRNRVKLDVSAVGSDEVALLLRLLSELPCSGSTLG